MKKIFALLFCSLLLMQCTFFSKTYTLDKKFEGELFCTLYAWISSGSKTNALAIWNLTWENVSINNAALPNCKESYAISAVINGVWYNDIFVSVDFNGIVTFKTNAPFIYESFCNFLDTFGYSTAYYFFEDTSSSFSSFDIYEKFWDYWGIEFLYALSKVKTKQYMEEFVKKSDIIGNPLFVCSSSISRSPEPYESNRSMEPEFTIIESKKETESSYKLIATLATGSIKIPVVCYTVDEDEARGLKKGDKVKFFGGGTLVDIEYSEKDGTISRLILKDCSVKGWAVPVINSKLNDSSFSESWEFTKKLPKERFGYLFHYVYLWMTRGFKVCDDLSIDRVDRSLNNDEEKYLVSGIIMIDDTLDGVSERYVRVIKDMLISRTPDGVITLSYKAGERALAENFFDFLNDNIYYNNKYLSRYYEDYVNSSVFADDELGAIELSWLYESARARIEKQEIEEFMKEAVIGKQIKAYFGMTVSSVIKTGQKSYPYKITCSFGRIPVIYYPAHDIDDFGAKKISELKEGDMLSFSPGNPIIFTDVEFSENGFTLVVKDAVTTKEKYDKLRESPSGERRSSGELMINGKVYSGDND